jgi:hypothetical protein
MVGPGVRSSSEEVGRSCSDAEVCLLDDSECSGGSCGGLEDKQVLCEPDQECSVLWECHMVWVDGWEGSKEVVG